MNIYSKHHFTVSWKKKKKKPHISSHIIPTRSLSNLFSKTDKDRIFSSSQDKFQRKLSIFSSVHSLCSHIPTILSKEEGLFDVP